MESLKDFVNDKNIEFGWTHTTSPLIYREVSISGSMPFYVGSYTAFWEYIYDYYNLEYLLPKDRIDQLKNDNIQVTLRNILWK